MRPLLFCLLLARAAAGQDLTLAEVRELLRPVCQAVKDAQHVDTPDLRRLEQEARQRMIAWAESRLAQVPPGASETTWTEDIRRAGLVCAERDQNNEGNQTGAVLGVRLRPIEANWLSLEIQFGSNSCARNDLLLLYRHQHGKWVRVLSPGHPGREQTWFPVLISQPGSERWGNSRNRLALTISNNKAACHGNDVTGTATLWSINDKTNATKRLAEKEFSTFATFRTNLKPDSALLEFQVRLRDDENHFLRNEPLHWQVRNGTATRIGPYALTPIHYVDSWLQENSKPGTLGRLDYGRQSFRCQSPANNYMVRSTNESKVTTYYLLEWNPPYRFRLLRTSPTPIPGCNLADPEAEDTGRRLLPQD